MLCPTELLECPLRDSACVVDVFYFTHTTGLNTETCNQNGTLSTAVKNVLLVASVLFSWKNCRLPR